MKQRTKRTKRQTPSLTPAEHARTAAMRLAAINTALRGDLDPMAIEHRIADADAILDHITHVRRHLSDHLSAQMANL